MERWTDKLRNNWRDEELEILNMNNSLEKFGSDEQRKGNVRRGVEIYRIYFSFSLSEG